MSRILKDKRANRGDTRRESIVRAAREICLEKGFSKITVSDIASKVGMTRSLFYHYFNDKDAVADAVLDDVIDEILTKLEEWNQAREIGNVNKALDEIVLVLRSLIADESPFSNRMIQDGNAELYIKFIDQAADRIPDHSARLRADAWSANHQRPRDVLHAQRGTDLPDPLTPRCQRPHHQGSHCTDATHRKLHRITAASGRPPLSQLRRQLRSERGAKAFSSS